MREIKLTQGQVALVDNADFEKLSKYKWFAHKKQNKHGATYYAERKPKDRTNYSMHKHIMGEPPAGHQIDHIDGNSLNNQRENLRFVTPAQNQMNRAPSGEKKYKGTYKADNKFAARISVNKKRIHLGRFKTEREAACAYDTAAKQHFKQFSKTNF